MQGKHGLFYLTDTDESGLFIAASSPEQAKELSAIARKALYCGGWVPHHAVLTLSGVRLVVPNCRTMTQEQSIETTLLVQKHMMTLNLSSEDA